MTWDLKSFDYKKMVHRELNVGTKDQKIRYGVGAGLVLISVFLGNIPFLLLGSILLITGKLRWCPVYSGFAQNSVDPNEAPATGCCGGNHEAQ